mgnify:CR=1 FL=1
MTNLKLDEQILMHDKKLIDTDDWNKYHVKNGDVIRLLKTDPNSRLRFVNSPLFIKGEDVVIKAQLESLVPMDKYATILC